MKKIGFIEIVNALTFTGDLDNVYSRFEAAGQPENFLFDAVKRALEIKGLPDDINLTVQAKKEHTNREVFISELTVLGSQ